MGTGRFKGIADWLRARDDFAVVTHIKPDGDAVGSSVALVLALEAMGKRAFATADGGMSPIYAFLDAGHRFFEPERAPFAPRYVVCVDCAEPNRIGVAEALVTAAADTVCIDHHKSNKGFGSLCVVDESRASAGELVLELLDELNAHISREMGMCLYAAIATDSGNFGFSNTKPETLRAAARCLETGFDIAEMNRRLFRVRRPARVRLLGMALVGMELTDEGRVCILRITEDMMTRCGATHADVERVVNYGSDTEGVVLAILAEQYGENTKLSLRSNDDTDVEAVTRRLGGGGHFHAAGALLSMPMEDAIRSALRELKKETQWS